MDTDVDSSPTLVSPCHAVDDDEPPTMRLPRSTPPPADEPTLLDAEIADEEIAADSEPETLRTWTLTPMPGSAPPASRIRAADYASTPPVRR
jgi:hypothetical protein